MIVFGENIKEIWSESRRVLLTDGKAKMGRGTPAVEQREEAGLSQADPSNSQHGSPQGRVETRNE